MATKYHSCLNRQGICFSHLTLCLTLIFLGGYCSRACPDLKITVYIFLLVPASHVTMTSWLKNFCWWKLLNLVSVERILCWSIFAVKPIADFCPFLGYRPSKNASRGHGIEVKFFSLAKPTLLCTIRKIILCWSIFATESTVDFCPFWGYWPWKNSPIVIGTPVGRILC